MEREYGSLSKILLAVRDRLINEISEISEMSCYVTDESSPTEVPPSDIFFTVSAGAGQFDEAMFDGGGFQTTTSLTNIVVAMFVRTPADRIDWAEGTLTDENQGLLSVFLYRTLRALLKDGDDAWEPSDDIGPILRSQIAPQSHTAAQLVTPGEGGQMVRFTRMDVVFSVEFDWNLE